MKKKLLLFYSFDSLKRSNKFNKEFQSLYLNTEKQRLKYCTDSIVPSSYIQKCWTPKCRFFYTPRFFYFKISL